MPKISKIRIVNLTYNDNRHIYNQTFDYFKGENALLTLANGGGKTVLVQMAMQPVVPNLKLGTRNFDSYFNKSTHPTYIMVEWLLDDNNGYLLTGLGVKKVYRTKRNSNESVEELRMITFTHEYQEENPYDIKNMPVLLDENGQVRMVPFDEIEKKLSTLEKGNEYKLKFYVLSNPEDKSRYNNELRTFKIYRDEFEKFIVKINEREAGVANFFQASKTSGALIKNEFLPIIDEQLNKEANTIKNIRELINNHAQTLVRNEEILREKELFETFNVKSQEILSALDRYNQSLMEIAHTEGQIGKLYAHLQEQFSLFDEKKKNYLAELSNIDAALKDLAYERESYEYHEDYEALLALKAELERFKTEHNKLIETLEGQRKLRAIFECAKLYQEYLDLDTKIIENEASLQRERLADQELETKIQDLKYTLKQKYAVEIQGASSKVNDLQTTIQTKAIINGQLETDKKDNKIKLRKVDELLIKLNDAISKFRAKEEHLQKYPEFTLTTNPITGEYRADEVERYKQLLTNKSSDVERGIIQKQKLQEENKAKADEARALELKLASESQKFQSELYQAEQKLAEYKAQKEEALNILRGYELGEENLFEKAKIIEKLDIEIGNYQRLIKEFNLELDRLTKELTMYESGRTFQLPKELLDFFSSNHIHVQFGFEWLKHYKNTLEAKYELVKSNPFIPYSLILTKREFERIRELDFNLFTSVTLPILERESLDQRLEVKSLNQIYSLGDVHFLMSFNQELLDEVHLAMIINSIKEKIVAMQNDVKQTEKAIDNVSNHKGFFLQKFLWTQLQVEELGASIRVLTENVIKTNEKIELAKNQARVLDDANTRLGKDISLQEKELDRLKRQIQESNELFVAYEKFLEDSRQRAHEESEQTRLTQLIQELNQRQQDLAIELNNLSHSLREAENGLTKLKIKAGAYSKASFGKMESGSIDDLEAQLKGFTEKQGVQAKWLTEQIARDEQQQAKIKAEMDGHEIDEAEYRDIVFSDIEFTKVVNLIKSLEKEKGIIHDKVVRAEEKIKGDEKNLVKKKNEITKFYEREPMDASQFQLNFEEREQQLLTSKEIANVGLLNAQSSTDKFDALVKSMDEYKELGLNVETIEPIVVEDLDAYKQKLLKTYKDKQKQESDKKAYLSNLYTLSEQQFVPKAPIFKQLFENILNTDKKFQLDYGKNAFERATIQINHKLDQYRVDYENMQTMEENIIGTAYDYVLNVYSEMTTIDSNSTIEIDGIRRKMLQVDLPDRTRLEEALLKEYVKGAIENCVRILKEDEQTKKVEPLLNSEITTERLFDKLVGLNRMEVNILKVEQNKVKYKKWAQANDISGGESFVSVFVVFVTLMSYLRGGNALKSFKGNEDGKVLIMDNPFGPITSDHLLIPMFNIAKKYNTQLICLTDITKRAVTDRFNVIYGCRVEKEIGRDHEYLDVRLDKNESLDNEELVSSLFKFQKKQMSMF